MKHLTATVPHQLSRAEAKRRLQEQFGTVRQQYGTVLTNLHESWNGDAVDFSLVAMGQSVTGRLTVDDQAVHIVVALPWLLRLFAGVVKPKIERQGRLLLAQQHDMVVTTAER